MATILPPFSPVVELDRERFAIECGSLEVFLTAMPDQATVLVAPIERTIRSRTGTWIKQFAVHVTTRGLASTAPVLYATFFAAEVAGAGSQGRLIAPYQQARISANALEQAHRLSAELYECCLQVFLVEPVVDFVLEPARYRLPDEWVWGVRSHCEGATITFHDGHWLPKASLPS